MKTLSYRSFAAFLILISLSVASCSKDALQKPGAASPVSGNSVQNKMTPSGLQGLLDSDPVDPIEIGSLRLAVAPIESKSSVTVYDGIYNSGEVFPTDSTGSYFFRRLTAGTYSILIHPYNPNYGDVIIDNILIEPDMVTDLGTIGL